MQHHGCFIVFEGIDGSGTTTQAQLLASELRQQQRLVHLTGEPSGGPFGAALRLAMAQRLVLPSTHLAATMALLFAADRLDHLASEIEPQLRDGAVVICDRYDLSSIAYQSATSRKGSEEDFAGWVRQLNRFARRPDLTIVIDVAPELAEQRRGKRRQAAEIYEEAALQRQLAGLYRKAEELVPGDSVAHVDGSADITEVSAAVLELALAAIAKRT